MTEREFRLRRRIDVLSDRLREEQARQARTSRADKRGRFCVYCGRPTHTTRRVPACSSHRDLVALDPVYVMEEAA